MEIPDCSMPMTFDTYSKCAYNCQYCFSYFQKSHSMNGYLDGSARCVDPEKVKALFEKAMKNDVIYYMFGAGRIQRPDKKHYRVCVIGVDYGQQNATAYEAWGIDDEKHRMTGLAEYYHSGRDTGRQKSPSEYAKDFENFLDGLYTDFGCGYFYAFIDPSARGLAEEVKRTCKGDKPYELLLRDANNDVALGIGRVQKLLTYQMMSMSPMQSMLIEEIGVYEYDKKSIESGKEVPVKEFDHGCDAMRYAVMGAWKRMKPYLPVKEYEKEYVAPIYR